LGTAAAKKKGSIKARERISIAEAACNNNKGCGKGEYFEESARGRWDRKKENAMKKLAKIGLCAAGYEWIHQVGGWRYAGGRHWVNEEWLGM